MSPDSLEEKTAPETKELPVVPLSIVIPAHNEEKTIAELLDLILKEKIDCEIIVSNSASTDNTCEVVKQYVSAHPDQNIHLVQSPLGVSNARNNGAQHAHGEYILFLDADTRFGHDFIKKSLEKMKKRKLDAAGFNFIPSTEHPVDRLLMAVNNTAQKVLEKTTKPVVTGAAMMIKRAFHQKIGGFPSNMEVFEDSAWAKKAAKEGTFGIINETAIFDTTRFHDKRIKYMVLQVKNTISMLLKGEVHKDLKDEYAKDRHGRKISDSD